MSLMRILCRKKIFSSRVIKRALLKNQVKMIIFTKNQRFMNPYLNLKRNYVTGPQKNNYLDQEITKQNNPQISDIDEYEQELKREIDAKWKVVRFRLIVLLSVMGIMIVGVISILVPPDTDEFGNKVEDEFSTLPVLQRYFYRLLREIDYINKMITEPSSNKLLPDINPADYDQTKYTLIIELHDLLVHADWTYQTGWRFKRRPDVDKFLELLSSPVFELVIFTSSQHSTSSEPLIEALDPNGYIKYKLGKECTQLSDGHYVKNLDLLNRDLSKVIVIDWNQKSLEFHRSNAIILPRWTGQDDDKTLIDLAMFVRTIAGSDVEDVREVLSYYSQFGNPIEQFRENRRKLLEQIDEREEKERKKESSLASKWANVFIKNSHGVNIK